MGGLVGREMGGKVSNEMAGEVGSPPACYGSSLGVRIQTSLKNAKMGDKGKGVANTL
jgi:hypothetical protein